MNVEEEEDDDDEDIDKNEYQALLNYCETGNLSELKKVIEIKPQYLNYQSSIGRTLLSSAITYDQITVLKYLIESGAAIEIIRGGLFTELLVAIHKGNLALVRYLVDNGANVNTVEYRPFIKTPLIAAVEANHPDIVEYLIHNGADVNYEYCEKSALKIAAQRGHVIIMKILIKYGASISVNGDEGIELFRCIVRHVDVVRYLSDIGLNLHSIDPFGSTLLMEAAISGTVEVVQYLVEKGADVNKLDNQGYDAFHFAVEKNHFEIIDFFLQSGGYNVDTNNQREVRSLVYMVLQYNGAGSHKDCEISAIFR